MYSHPYEAVDADRKSVTAQALLFSEKGNPMCGILAAAGPKPVTAFLDAAGTAQAHRGPDFKDTIHHEIAGRFVGLGHQRLSVLDLTSAGNQPIVSRSGVLEMVFNGEIYNFEELRDAHGLHDLASTGDAAVAIELIEKLGMQEACRQFNGMWAIVVFDHRSGMFEISRDRFGKKPLNMTQVAGAWYFASEIKSFLSIEGFDATPDAVTAARFLSQSLSNVDARSFLCGSTSFPPGHTARLALDDLSRGLIDCLPFWSLDVTDQGQSDAAKMTDGDLRDLVADAVKLRLRADVPVGIALSGGLDSSIIAAVARKHQDTDLTLLSVTSPGHKEDEGHFIRIMGQHLNNPVQTFSLNDKDDDLVNLFETCLWHNDGPLPSFAGVLFYKLMEVTNQLGITVVLTGQGADEAFCGYRKYPFFVLRSLIAQRKFGQATAFLSQFIARGTMLPQMKLAEMKRYLDKSNDGILGSTTTAAFDPEAMRPSGKDVAVRQKDDLLRLSVPFLCHYEDRMSMAWSREIRSPFLDYRVVEAGLNMTYDRKMSGGWTKYALRRAFDAELPSEITWRKDKKGFTNPQDNWLKQRLRTHVLDTMSDKNAPVYHHGLVDRAAYLALFQRYLDGDRSIWFRDVFGPYSLNSWLRKFSH
jgi:asparagine synthase (glutamine-hydrolysing)